MHVLLMINEKLLKMFIIINMFQNIINSFFNLIYNFYNKLYRKITEKDNL